MLWFSVGTTSPVYTRNTKFNIYNTADSYCEVLKAGQDGILATDNATRKR